MKLSTRLKLFAATSILIPLGLHAQVSFLEIDQQENVFNRVETGSGLVGLSGATSGQFKAVNSFSSSAPISGITKVGAPSSSDGKVKIGFIRVGANLYGRFSSYRFGEVLSLPTTNAAGEELDTLGKNPTDHWQPRPFRESDRLEYYWDESRKRVVSTANVGFDITWRKKQAEPGQPSDFAANPSGYYVVSGVYYKLYSHTHASVSPGNAIAPPNVEADGTTQLEENDVSYWNSRPYDLQDTERYHYSVSANAVFATQPGPMTVIWQELNPRSLVALNMAGQDYISINGMYYGLFSKRYIISGSPVKAPKKMYWTGAGNPGIPVPIPLDRVSEVNIVYNSDFPENVPVSEGAPLNEGTGIGTETSGGGVVTAATIGTLWYSSDEKALKALNRQGRVFVEFLGTPDSITGVPAFLGFEVVDIIKRPIPFDEKVALGDSIPAVLGVANQSPLTPRLANQVDGGNFVYRHFGSHEVGTVGDLAKSKFYATQETENLNDLIMWWLESGVEGTLWPAKYYRYDLKWPTAENRYNHYIRPVVDSVAEAIETSVQLKGEEVPVIEFQDDAGSARAKITSDFRFYTYLDESFPAHRTLLRYISGDAVRFERVFSWLEKSLTVVDSDGSFSSSLLKDSSVAKELDSFDSASEEFVWADASASASVFDQTVYVGDRLGVPSTAIGSADGEVYWAGYVNLKKGDSINPNSYLDPFVSGFEEANLGSIIPVNAIPSDNALEVMWFRRSDDNETDGFSAHYWPSVLGRYTIKWPSNAPDIVLASNDGSGPLSSLLAKGSIYYVNDKTQTGYNPNEEHALMQGGQVFAIRDDLNVTTNDSGEYSSQPYVLVEYEDSDGRTSMTPFEVLQENVTKGEVFTYPVEAGTILQAPMPLPLMELPLLKSGVSEGFNVNREATWIQIVTSNVDSASTQVWDFTTEQAPVLSNGTAYNLQSEDLTESKVLVVERSSFVSNTVHGQVGSLGVRLDSLSVADLAPFGWGYNASIDQDPNVYFKATNPATGAIAALVKNNIYTLYSSVRATTIEMKMTSIDTGNGIDVLRFRAPAETFEDGYLYNDVVYTDEELEEVYDGDSNLSAMKSYSDFKNGLSKRYRFDDILFDDLVIIDFDPTLADGALDDWYVSQSNLTTADLVETGYRAKFTFQDRKGNMWVYRGPHDEMGPSSKEAFSVQYYYKTLEGFYFPEESSQPAVGDIVPYLRNKNTNGSYVGSAVDNEGQALAISYQPYWPATTPVLFTGESLTNPKRGLPAVRGQISAEVLYQQSERTKNKSSVTLHDPTRDKSYPLSSGGLGKVPGSAVTENYLGKTYFSLLPPHLGNRFFFDSSRGENGELVFRGEFVDETLGEDYLLLNVLSDNDKAKLKALVVTGDADKAKWDIAIDGLSTTLETFVKDVDQPGSYIPNVGQNKTVGIGELATIGNADIAVDSYAISAVGPGSGFVTMIFGNGEAFTPIGDPVVMQVLQVSDDLYRGEVKPIQSSNPLNEMLTMQQISDFAGMADEYEFEWLIASPVDGLPPVVTENERVLLMGDGSWSHLRFPTKFDTAKSVFNAASARVNSLSVGSITALETIPFTGVVESGVIGEYEFTASEAALVETMDRFVMRDTATEALLMSSTDSSTATVLSLVALEADKADAVGFEPVSLEEEGGSDIPSSIVYRRFTSELDLDAAAVFLSMDLSNNLGARVYVNDVEVVLANMQSLDADLANTATTGAPAGFLSLTRVYSVPTSILALGAEGATERTHTVSVELYSEAVAGVAQTFNLRVEAFDRIDHTEANWLALSDTKYLDGVRTILGETADVRALADNYLIMHYRPLLQENGNPWGDDTESGYSQWTTPALAEGWIKRVLAGINPFNQRVTNLFSNRVDTDASVLTEAGARWEGDVALNIATINDYGLIEIYETVLNRGRMLSIDAGINYGPANDALLLAAGYLSDLYSLLGDEAKADALNPTIGIGTADNTYGDIATSMFSFGGQVATLLEEELALWRGRSDFLQPGVEITPVYNRLVWNYTRGIDSGEVIYALNYNIKENQDGDIDGIVNAEDAAKQYPQGHGDAYGHYLTALKNYYKLFMNSDFTWVPRIEAVNILGVPVSVDYQDERKFATVAVEQVKAGLQVLELTWRADFENVEEKGWDHFSDTRTNTRRAVPTTRYWGVDHWASRSQQGAYFNWVVGNAMLPDVDRDSTHEGIQIVDRTTVTELQELTYAAESIRASLDNAEAGLNPLRLAGNSVAFDLNPNGFGLGETSHFEQVYDRAKVALNNAVIAFDDAKDVTRLMRSEEDSLNGFQAKIDAQELSYRDQLVEIYGTPYPDDIGPGETYVSGFYGPDLVHYRYVDDVTLDFNGTFEKKSNTYTLDVIKSPESKLDNWAANGLQGSIKGNTTKITFNLSSNGFMEKPKTWKSTRQYAGKLQLAINDIAIKRDAVYLELENYIGETYVLKRQLDIFMAKVASQAKIKGYNEAIRKSMDLAKSIVTGTESSDIIASAIIERIDAAADILSDGVPLSAIFGLAAGGDIAAPVRAAIDGANLGITSGLTLGRVASLITGKVAATAAEVAANGIHFNDIVPAEILQTQREEVYAVDAALQDLNGRVFPINRSLQESQRSLLEYQALEAKGIALQAEREIFRKRSAAVVQGYRTRNVAFRLFRNEKLERYKSLFDLAARYVFLAAQAYDYETGLLGSKEGQDFIARIVQSRALGVVKNGEPQFAGSDSGDPGLSSILAEMAGDWSVLKSRLGFNNPDIYGTTFSLREEKFRILPGSEGDDKWRDVLKAGRVANVLEDPDVRRYAMQIDVGDGLPVPGIVIEFSTNVTNGRNFMGNDLAAGDHTFSPTSFATKIYSSGIVLQGYQGMDNPSRNSGATDGSSSPSTPDISFLDDTALSATPYVYLIPVGKDIMRTPPLGDESVLRGWTVQDVTIPLPFNIGASEHSSKSFYNSSDSLSEPLFGIRKHQAFRPVSTADVYNEDNKRLFPSEFTNTRLIGRSVWNTRWKIIIPGRTLLADPDEGLSRFIDSVEDIKLHLETYSYSGN